MRRTAAEFGLRSRSRFLAPWARNSASLAQPLPHLDNWIHRWCTDQQDEQLADATVYTEGQSPEQVATEIVTRLQHHEAQTHPPAEQVRREIS